jgi:dTDP-glucose 4,6-dehydratase
MKYKSLLIIGGTGFFGKSILDYFKSNNHLAINKIIIFSRKKQNIQINKILKKKIKIIKISENIRNIKKLPRADYVIYAAISKNFRDDYLALKNYTNLALKYHKNCKILFTSSGAVYGIQPNNIKGFKENYLNFNKKKNFTNSYKKSYSNLKLKSEKLFQELGTKGIKVSIARCFCFVGEYLPLNSNFIVGNFIKSILKKKNLNIKANYLINRSYMFSDDLARWLLKILYNSNKSCPIFNVGSDNKVRMDKIGKILAKKNHLAIDIPKITSKNFDNYLPNIMKAKKYLGLQNRYTSLEAILKTINVLKRLNISKK